MMWSFLLKIKSLIWPVISITGKKADKILGTQASVCLCEHKTKHTFISAPWARRRTGSTDIRKSRGISLTSHNLVISGMQQATDSQRSTGRCTLTGTLPNTTFKDRIQNPLKSMVLVWSVVLDQNFNDRVNFFYFQ